MARIIDHVLIRVDAADIQGGCYTIPDGVTEIGDRAFRGLISLERVIIRPGVTKIGICAFKGCTNLTSVIIPDSVTELGLSAFEGCTSLKSVTIGKGITKIQGGTFFGCASLVDVTIPDNVITLGMNAFTDCENLNSIILHSRIKGTSNAFHGCPITTVHIIAQLEEDTGDIEAAFPLLNNDKISYTVEYTQKNEEGKNTLPPASPHYLRNAFFPAVGSALVANSVCLGGLTIALFLSTAACPVAFALPLLSIAIAALGLGLLLLAASGVAHIADAAKGVNQ